MAIQVTPRLRELAAAKAVWSGTTMPRELARGVDEPLVALRRHAAVSAERSDPRSARISQKGTMPRFSRLILVAGSLSILVAHSSTAHGAWAGLTTSGSVEFRLEPGDTETVHSQTWHCSGGPGPVHIWIPEDPLQHEYLWFSFHPTELVTDLGFGESRDATVYFRNTDPNKISTRAEPSPYKVFLPGDVAPDNTYSHRNGYWPAIPRVNWPGSDVAPIYDNTLMIAVQSWDGTPGEGAYALT
jgi:hypothetical protein